MFAYISGILEDLDIDNAVIDVQGMGFNVKISTDTASRLPGIGEMVKLYTYTLVREDAFSLYGFLSRNELNIFKQCITVNGIGPKGALAILSTLDADSLRFAIMSGDTKAIAKAPGIGAKTAERLILDLKDKIKIDDTLINKEIKLYGTQISTNDPQQKEAVDALVALGYGQSEAMKAVSAIENIGELDSGAILKAALKHLF